MKSLTKTTKTILTTSVAAAMFAAAAVTLTACGDDGLKPGTYKYDATLEAGITMNQAGTFSFGDVLSDAYLTCDGESDGYTLTLIFQKGTLTVMGSTGTIFVDDNPGTQKTDNNGVADGTIGIYHGDELVTEGVTLTYSTGSDYAVNSAKKYVHYVQSAAFPVQSVSETYDIALYINSNMMGQEFTKDSYSAKVHLDLSTQEEVEEISGLGDAVRAAEPKAVETMTFTVDEVAESYNLSLYVTAFNSSASSGMQFPYISTKTGTSHAVLTVTETEGENGTVYTAELHAVVTMGNSDVDFAVNLLKSISVKEVSGKYEITLTFKYGTVNMPYGNVMTGYVNNVSSVGYGGAVVTPVFGYLVGEEVVTEGVTLTVED